jgi:methyl-accepting chemotaxis protein
MDNTDDALEGEAKRSEARAVAVVRRSKIAISSICLISSLVLMVLASRTARGINLRMVAVIQRLKSMAAGDLTLNVDDNKKDELGEIAHWFNDSLAKLRDAIGKVALSAGSVSTATEELTNVSREMTSNSEETTTQASAAASSTDEVSRNLQTVAAGTEEMNTSIRDIAKNVTEASEVARKAVKVAETTNNMISKLASPAQKSARLSR